MPKVSTSYKGRILICMQNKKLVPKPEKTKYAKLVKKMKIGKFQNIIEVICFCQVVGTRFYFLFFFQWLI